MDLSEWFSYQMKASGEGFVWAVEQIAVERREIDLPATFGEWSVKRHAFHLLFHERDRVLPTVHHWLGEALPSFDESPKEAEMWERVGNTQSIEKLLTQFQEARAALLALLPRFTEENWHEVRAIGISVDLIWPVTKAHQHTLNHTNTVLAMTLFWDYL